MVEAIWPGTTVVRSTFSDRPSYGQSACVMWNGYVMCGRPFAIPINCAETPGVRNGYRPWEFVDHGRIRTCRPRNLRSGSFLRPCWNGVAGSTRRGPRWVIESNLNGFRFEASLRLTTSNPEEVATRPPTA